MVKTAGASITKPKSNTKHTVDYIQNILDTIREPLIILDKDFKLITANNSFYQTFQVTPTETKNHYIFEPGGGQWNILKLRSLLEKILPQKTKFENFEVEHIFPKIGKKIMLLNARRIIYPDHQNEAILLAIEDITHQKELDRRKDEFISMASHELKTPVATIKGLTQILKQYFNQDQKATYFLNKMENQTGKLTELVSDLLDVSKIQSGKLKLNKEKFDLEELIKDIAEDMRQTYEGHKIYLLGKTPTAILADKYRLNQVLINLISNAIKFSPESDKVIINLTQDGKNVIVSVTDFGIGISKRDQKLVFESFFQAQNRIRQSSAGLGLGLYISKQIIDRHRGKIWVSSEKGKGSIFSFKLPKE